ncbi:MAG: hypothetical protein WA890_14975 [Micromonospora sp.]
MLRHTARQMVNQRPAMPLYACLPTLAVAQALEMFSLSEVERRRAVTG